MEKKSRKIKDKTKEVESEETTSVDKGKVLISWEAPEFEYNPKNISWYWLSLILSIVLVAIALWQKNFLFAIFIAIAWLTVVSLAGKHPSYWKFTLDGKGLTIQPIDKPEEIRKFYPFSEMTGFDIHDGAEEFKELVIKFKSRLTPFMKINFKKEDEEKIAVLFSKFLPREEYNESLADSLAKVIKF